MRPKSGTSRRADPAGEHEGVTFPANLDLDEGGDSGEWHGNVKGLAIDTQGRALCKSIWITNKILSAAGRG